jgi:hypothetical protein
VPAWGFRRVTADVPGDVRLLHVTVLETRADDRQPWEYLLCGVCEQRLCKWEDYASEMLAQPDGTFPWRAACRPLARRDEFELLDSSGVDTDVEARLCSKSN